MRNFKAKGFRLDRSDVELVRDKSNSKKTFLPRARVLVYPAGGAGMINDRVGEEEVSAELIVIRESYRCATGKIDKLGMGSVEESGGGAGFQVEARDNRFVLSRSKRNRR